jgi:predicted ATPase with chaperone activity
VEADIGAGLPRTVLVGLPDSALYQSRDRCMAAVSNSEQEWPISLLTINLSPATLPKAGSHYDVAIVAAVLAAQGVFRSEELRGTVLLGELGLDGRLRPVRGVCPPLWRLNRPASPGYSSHCAKPERRNSLKALGSLVLPRSPSRSPFCAAPRHRRLTPLRSWVSEPAGMRTVVST